MKKFISMVVAVLIIGSSLIGIRVQAKENSENRNYDEELIDDISNKIIRFHVIANSDENLDQQLKLKVRDRVLEYVQPLLKDSDDIEESRKILARENEKLIEIAKSVVEEEGYNYDVNSTLTRENFPVKTYGNITLPQGEYEAYRIIIGSGEGQNWWCVMFPPICFVDITKGEVAYEETEEEMSRVLSEEELDLIDENRKAIVDSTEDNEIVVKFKIIDTVKEIFK